MLLDSQIRKPNEMAGITGIMGKAGAGKDTIANMIIQRLHSTRYSFADPLKEMCSFVFMLPLEAMYDQELKEHDVIINLRNDHVIRNMTEWVENYILGDPKFKWCIIKPELSGIADFGTRAEQAAMSLLNVLGNSLRKLIDDHAVIECGNNNYTFRLTIRLLLQLLGTEVVRNTVDEGFWSDIKKNVNGQHVIVPDCRFSNEVDFIIEHGGIVCMVENLDLKRDDLNGHVSEKFVDEAYDYIQEKYKVPVYIFRNNLSGDYESLEEQVNHFIQYYKDKGAYDHNYT